MFIHVSRGPSYLGGHSCHSNYRGGLAPAFLKMRLMLATLIPPQHLFPEGIGAALIEVGCEEAWRESSQCAPEEFMRIPGNTAGSGFQEEMLESKKRVGFPLVPSPGFN